MIGFSSTRSVPKNLGGLFSKHICHWREGRAAVLSKPGWMGLKARLDGA